MKMIVSGKSPVLLWLKKKKQKIKVNTAPLKVLLIVLMALDLQAVDLVQAPPGAGQYPNYTFSEECGGLQRKLLNEEKYCDKEQSRLNNATYDRFLPDYTAGELCTITETVLICTCRVLCEYHPICTDSEKKDVFRQFIDGQNFWFEKKHADGEVCRKDLKRKAGVSDENDAAGGSEQLGYAQCVIDGVHLEKGEKNKNETNETNGTNNNGTVDSQSSTTTNNNNSSGSQSTSSSYLYSSSSSEGPAFMGVPMLLLAGVIGVGVIIGLAVGTILCLKFGPNCSGKNGKSSGRTGKTSRRSAKGKGKGGRSARSKVKRPPTSRKRKTASPTTSSTTKTSSPTTTSTTGKNKTTTQPVININIGSPNSNGPSRPASSRPLSKATRNSQYQKKRQERIDKELKALADRLSRA